MFSPSGYHFQLPVGNCGWLFFKVLCIRVVYKLLNWKTKAVCLSNFGIKVHLDFNSCCCRQHIRQLKKPKQTPKPQTITRHETKSASESTVPSKECQAVGSSAKLSSKFLWRLCKDFIQFLSRYFMQTCSKCHSLNKYTSQSFATIVEFHSLSNWNCRIFKILIFYYEVVQIFLKVSSIC